jgi:hypothetical protein
VANGGRLLCVNDPLEDVQELRSGWWVDGGD